MSCPRCRTSGQCMTTASRQAPDDEHDQLARRDLTGLCIRGMLGANLPGP